MLRVLVGDRDEDYRRIIGCGERRVLRDWAVPKDTIPGDEAVIYVERHGFVARAIVSTAPTPGPLGNRPAYRSDLSEVHCLPAPVPLAYIQERLPTWGWLRQKMKSRHTPDAAVARLLAESLTDYQSGLEPVHEPAFSEGRAQRSVAVRYERDPAARYACIERHGCTCAACGFEFGAAYGPVMDGFILVHHLEPLSASGATHTDPAKDLRPVCANCHVVMHRRNPPFTVEEVKRMLDNRRVV